MVYSNLSKSVKDIKAVQESMSTKHKEIIKILDSTDLEGLPVMSIQDFPNKIWLDIYSFEKLTYLANDLYDLDALKSEKIDRFQEGIQDIGKLKKMTKLLRGQLDNILLRVKKDSKFIEKIIKRVSSVISEFRERCRTNLIEFLKSLDIDLRRILKPLVPTSVVDENVQFPKLNETIRDTLRSTIEKEENEDEGKTENDRLTSHINMLVGTLEKVAKELLQVLHETNRKYYEVVNPSQLYSEAPTPLAMPLPEYFTFDNIENHHLGLPKEDFDKKSIENLKMKVERLLRRGSLSNQEAKRMLEKIDNMILHNSNDLEQVLRDIPNSKREEIVFQIIHSSIRYESHCSPRTERKEIEVKISNMSKNIENVEKKSVTPMERNDNKRIFKGRNSVPAVPRLRKNSLPKPTSMSKMKKNSIKEIGTRTPTKPGSKRKKSKKLLTRNNKSFLSSHNQERDSKQLTWKITIIYLYMQK